MNNVLTKSIALLVIGTGCFGSEIQTPNIDRL